VWETLELSELRVFVTLAEELQRQALPTVTASAGR
jgi:hypothetical protein